MEGDKRNGVLKAESEKAGAVMLCPTPGCGKRLPVSRLHVSGSLIVFCRHCRKEVRICIVPAE